MHGICVCMWHSREPLLGIWYCNRRQTSVMCVVALPTVYIYIYIYVHNAMVSAVVCGMVVDAATAAHICDKPALVYTLCVYILWMEKDEANVRPDRHHTSTPIRCVCDLHVCLACGTSLTLTMHIYCLLRVLCSGIARSVRCVYIPFPHTQYTLSHTHTKQMPFIIYYAIPAYEAADEPTILWLRNTFKTKWKFSPSLIFVLDSSLYVCAFYYFHHFVISTVCEQKQKKNKRSFYDWITKRSSRYIIIRVWR